MKDAGEAYYREYRPDKSALETITFCLEQLFRSKTGEAEDEIVKNFTFEELIGALLLAEDKLKEVEEEEKEAERKQEEEDFGN